MSDGMNFGFPLYPEGFPYTPQFTFNWPSAPFFGAKDLEQARRQLHEAARAELHDIEMALEDELRKLGWVKASETPVNPDLEEAIEQARRVTRTEREVEYAHPLMNFVRAAVRMTQQFHDKLHDADGEPVVFSPYDMALSMVEWKMARMDNHAAVRKDNVTDGIGYYDCYDRIALWLYEHREEEWLSQFGDINSYADAVHFFDEWDMGMLYEFQLELEHNM